MKYLLLAFLLFTSSMVGAQVNNSTVIPLSSALQTAAEVNSNDITNTGWVGADIIINVSAYTSGTYTPHIQGRDPASGVYYDILVGAAISSAGTTVLHVCAGCLGVPNVSAQAALPLKWRVQLIGASTPSMLLSVGANLVK